MKKHYLSLLAGCMLTVANVSAQRQLQLNCKPGVPIQSTMYGIFFEDINYAADGGIYAEMVENRSFEFPFSFLGWTPYGNVTLDHHTPAFDRNPAYVKLRRAGHGHKRTGLENHGFFGMGLKEGMQYHFSVYARLTDLESKPARFSVELVGSDNNPICADTITVNSNRWKKYTGTLTSSKTDAKGMLRIFLLSDEGVDMDHISLFPADSRQGLRADLVQALADLHPGVFRFPGGCIVEGTELATRYQWKKTLGAPENRPLNENRWNYEFPYRMSPNYYQTGGLGFYEYFLLAETIGAEPLPVVSCGLACQFQNRSDDSLQHASLDELQPFIDDALDLIEFANGAVTTTWGKVRADMGHPKPFFLKQIAIGNEQWGPEYFKRLKPFIEQIRKRYPDIKIVGSSGALPFDYVYKGEDLGFSAGWKAMTQLGVDLVDEHYYQSPQWFLDNAGRYDNYSRKGPKVFAGEYAAHGQGQRNNFEAALAEACFMTGLERNADVVYQATYAPLFAHVEGWQWKPDLIWFDNLTSVRSVSWYVQQLYGTYKGTHVLSLTESGKPVEGSGSLYASAVTDKAAGKNYIKIGNAGNTDQKIVITLKGGNLRGTVRILSLHDDDPMAENTLQQKERVTPKEHVLAATGTRLTLEVPAKTFMVVEL